MTASYQHFNGHPVDPTTREAAPGLSIDAALRRLDVLQRAHTAPAAAEGDTLPTLPEGSSFAPNGPLQWWEEDLSDLPEGTRAFGARCAYDNIAGYAVSRGLSVDRVKEVAAVTTGLHRALLFIALSDRRNARDRARRAELGIPDGQPMPRGNYDPVSPDLLPLLDLERVVRVGRAFTAINLTEQHAVLCQSETRLMPLVPVQGGDGTTLVVDPPAPEVVPPVVNGFVSETMRPYRRGDPILEFTQVCRPGSDTPEQDVQLAPNVQAELNTFFRALDYDRRADMLRTLQELAAGCGGWRADSLSRLENEALPRGIRAIYDSLQMLIEENTIDRRQLVAMLVDGMCRAYNLAEAESSDAQGLAVLQRVLSGLKRLPGDPQFAASEAGQRLQATHEALAADLAVREAGGWEGPVIIDETYQSNRDRTS